MLDPELEPLSLSDDEGRPCVKAGQGKTSNAAGINNHHASFFMTSPSRHRKTG